MRINTTIYIKIFLLSKISKVASSYNVSINHIVFLIILKTMQDKKINPKMFRSVRYQDKDIPSNWHTQHISFDPDIYEKALDLKKIVKMSVSKIIAEGIKKYLDEIISEFCEEKNYDDNYHHKYVFFSKNYNNLFHFIIFWNSPSEYIKKNYFY